MKNKIILLSLALLSCLAIGFSVGFFWPHPSDTPDTQSVKMIAHRGWSSAECENTAAAFIAAGNRSYYAIECDVHLTKDGQFVIIHDATTGAVCDTDLTVADSTWADLSALVLHDKNGIVRQDQRIPLLEDYLRICKTYGKVAEIELKAAFSREDIGRIVDLCRDTIGLEQVMFVSFDINNLLYVREFTDAPAQYVCKTFHSTDIRTVMQEKDIDLAIKETWLTKKEHLDELHDWGFSVNAWTVNDPARAAQLAEWGVDFITTDVLE